MTAGQSALVTASAVDDATAEAIDRQFFEQVGNAEASRTLFGRGVPLIARVRLSKFLTRLGSAQKVPPIRMVEKTPDNCFRIQMLLRVFPDAQFVYVVRDPRGAIASIHKGWTEETRFQRFRPPPDFTIEGYGGKSWCFGRPPGWESMNGASVMEICAYQWRLYNEYCHRDLPQEEDQVFCVRYEEITSDPGSVLMRLAQWAGLEFGPLERYSAKLPVVNTWTKPDSDKWRRVEAEIGEVLPSVAAESERLGYAS
jgi:hypothetical protein